MAENRLLAPFSRLLQHFARFGPGAGTLRVVLHRWRGVKIGKGVWIGYDAIIETSYPYLVEIQDGAAVGIRATIIAHFREVRGVVLEQDAVLGPGVIVMPGVRIGRGAVVTAGSVVTRSVPPMTVVQGNPAVPIAKVGIPMKMDVTLKSWVKALKPIRRP
jgi:acetyltransferase-like isoleucine patch superfamily enzyme